MTAKHGEAESYYYNQSGGPQQMQYPPQPNLQQPPPNCGHNYDAGPPPQVPTAGPGDGKQTFDQAFKLEKPKYNDLWAGILVYFPFHLYYDRIGADITCVHTKAHSHLSRLCSSLRSVSSGVLEQQTV